VKDPKRTPATASLFDLQGLQKNFLSNHALWSPAWVDTYAISRPPVSPCNTFAYPPYKPTKPAFPTPFIQLGFVSFWVSHQNSSLWCFEPNMSLCYNFQHIHNSRCQVSDSGKRYKSHGLELVSNSQFPETEFLRSSLQSGMLLLPITHAEMLI
jgi:hypothetical protein